MPLRITQSQRLAIKEATQILEGGGLVAMPTETVYGLAADASNEDAISKVFSLKGRPSDRPLIVHIGQSEWLERWACEIPSYAHALIKAFWPGPLTLVLPKQRGVSTKVTGGQSTVAVRVPNHPVALALLQSFGKGLVAPSANRYGHISPTSASDVTAEFGDEIPLILDGGSCEVGIESTIVSCLSEGPRILRLGSISPQALASVLGRSVEVGSEEAVVVPGQVLSHYAPKTPTRRWTKGDQSDPNLHFVDQKVGFLGFFDPPIGVEQAIVLPLDPVKAGAALYRSLRLLDEAGLNLILVAEPPIEDEWDAIRDRMQRASAGV